MRLDVAINALTFGALQKNLITIFGGNQIRPNLTMHDMVNSYCFFLKRFLVGVEDLYTYLELKKIFYH